MKASIDNFSKQAAIYQQYRPSYPESFYHQLLALVENRTACWDVGTGNGQVAVALSKHFDQVFATDISQQQLAQASTRANITYRVERAEKTSFPADQFDFITVAQAIHWFDFPAFYKEVRRVGKTGGILAVWGYGLHRVSPQIDAHIDIFYRDVIGDYWNEERRHIDERYESIGFDFKTIELDQNLEMEVAWSLEQLEGYLNSWSSVQHFKKAHPETDPVAPTIAAIRPLWEDGTHKPIKFPIFTKIGRIE
ncbi:MAG: class I SAM-dependent methyltransferase [Bacteroidota bacterium]